MVEGAPEAVRWLTALGAAFDTGPGGEMLLGREAAHSRRRVLHAGGDATGAEIERALVARVREDRHVDVFAGAFVVDLVVADGRCRGVIAELEPGAELTYLEAPVTVLAAGGAGHLWATTSNPAGATADGLAMALRAGAAVADTEFVQFHPTVLAVPGATPFLVSEAVRGEGAYLRDAAGERFMLGNHELAELAPRDVVARGIQQQMLLDHRDHVDLDLRHLDADEVRARFPTITAELAQRGLDLATDLIPVAPAAHYFIGGVVADTEGQTSLPGLLAFGEAASTGIHGANRLASNSLLEGLVFGMAGADRLAAEWPRLQAEAAALPLTAGPITPSIGLGGDFESLRRRLQRVMSQHVAVVRNAEGLATARQELDAIERELDAQIGVPESERRERWELRNLIDAARAVIDNAGFRQESRGAHYRSDYPATEPDLAGQHTLLDAEGARAYGKLANALPDPAMSG
ncbi:MAG: FAD-binding protein [Thermomicrobiales bacterium]